MHYDRNNPSPRYLELLSLYTEMHRHGDQENSIPPEKMFDGKSLLAHIDPIKGLIDQFNVSSLLDYGCGKARTYDQADLSLPSGKKINGVRDYWGVNDIRFYDPGYEEHSELPTTMFDCVVSTDVLEHCPEEDLEWIVNEIFGFSRKFVLCTVALYAANKSLPNGENAHVTVKSIGWWVDLFEKASTLNNRRKFYLIGMRTYKDMSIYQG